jgi:hypothetical protein
MIGNMNDAVGQLRINDSFTKGVDGNTSATGGFLKQLANAVTNLIPGGVNKVPKTIVGDHMTLTDVATTTEDTTFERKGVVEYQSGTQIQTVQDKIKSLELEKHGMPFYFKDLRDGVYLVFRAYLTGINENVSPTWNSKNFVGRSEPVWMYDSTTRDVSFSLSIVAQTEEELKVIYQKVNRLTSMCYPEYAEDTLIKIDGKGKFRKKPPLIQMRMGELFGSEKNEMTGFLKSVAYTYPDSSPWETKRGMRVPKFIQAAISFQVIHNEPASHSFTQKVGRKGVEFYGINTNKLVGVDNSGK